MPCSCSPGCSCASAATCAGSDCFAAGLAATNIAATAYLVGSYHRMWYPDSDHAGQPNHEEEEEIRETMRDRDEVSLQGLREKLKQVESESPRGPLRTEAHLDREKKRLTERIRRLEHEVSILSG